MDLIAIRQEAVQQVYENKEGFFHLLRKHVSKFYPID